MDKKQFFDSLKNRDSVFVTFIREEFETENALTSMAENKMCALLYFNKEHQIWTVAYFNLEEDDNCILFVDEGPGSEGRHLVTEILLWYDFGLNLKPWKVFDMESSNINNAYLKSILEYIDNELKNRNL